MPIQSAELKQKLKHEGRLWQRQLGSKAGEQVFIDGQFAGEIQLKPERYLALLKILHPPEAHFTPAKAPAPYPLQQGPYTYQKVSHLQKRLLELYDVPPYEKEKQYIDGGWDLKGENLPRPRPTTLYGLPRVTLGISDSDSKKGCKAGKMAPTIKANQAGRGSVGVSTFRGRKVQMVGN